MGVDNRAEVVPSAWNVQTAQFLYEAYTASVYKKVYSWKIFAKKLLPKTFNMHPLAYLALEVFGIGVGNVLLNGTLKMTCAQKYVVKQDFSYNTSECYVDAFEYKETCTTKNYCQVIYFQ